MGLSTATPQHHTQTKIQNRNILYLGRALWMGVIGFALLVYLSTLPSSFTILRDSARYGGGYTDVLGSFNITQTQFAAYMLAIEIVFLVLLTTFAVTIIWRRSNDWLVLLATAIFVLAPISASTTLHQGNNIIGGIAFGFATSLLYTFMLVFPDGKFQPQWGWMTLPIVIPIFFTTGYFTSRMLGGDVLPIHIIIPNLIGGVLSFTAIFAQVYRYRRVATQLQRQQTKWLIVGATTFLIVGSLFVALQFIPTFRTPLIFPESAQYTQTTLLVLLVFTPITQFALHSISISIGLAILRFRLWNVDVVLNRWVVSALQLLILILLFFVTFVLMRIGLSIILSSEQEGIAIGISAALIAAVFNPVRIRVQSNVDRYLFGLRFDLNELNAAQRPANITNPGILTGKILNGYEVMGLIGQGGMGEVYRGTGNGETVAIKTMLPKIARDPDMRKRFEREAETGRLLNHPNIAKVFDNGEIDGMPYLIMDYIEGEDLSDRLKQGTVDEETTIQIMRDICAALDTAHAEGFVHRDMKPSNIMIQENGTAILMDFGITKVSDASTSLTGTGAVGTIDYMAPEQISAASEVDHRADIYALGVILFEMLTGDTPFKGSAAQVLFAHLTQPVPDPLDVNPDIPQALVDVIEMAMAKDPDARFQSAGEFAKALRI